MRGVITCSGIIVVIALIVMIHASITGNNIRRDEVNRSLDGAMDFAFDRMGDVYADKYFTTYDAGKRQQILTDLMEEFCVVLSCLLYTSPSPRDRSLSRMPSSA